MVAIRGLGDVAPHVKAAAQEIADKFNVSNIGGRASSGHISGSDHYTGHAIDVMVYKDKAKGDAVLQYAFSNWARLGIKYAIWYRKYYPQPNKAEPYIGPSPHTDHVHLSFNKQPGTGGAAIDTLTGGDSSDPLGCVGQFIDLLNKA